MEEIKQMTKIQKSKFKHPFFFSRRLNCRARAKAEKLNQNNCKSPCILSIRELLSFYYKFEAFFENN